MGMTKTDGFTRAQLELAAFTKALGHPARITILQFLASRKSCVCGGIVDELPLSQSTVSQHLKELKTAGLIKGDFEGPTVCYCINEIAWNRAKDALNGLFGLYEGNDCC
jgi:DNA-binding transcriptional ArsR family regulator